MQSNQFEGNPSWPEFRFKISQHSIHKTRSLTMLQGFGWGKLQPVKTVLIGREKVRQVQNDQSLKHLCFTGRGKVRSVQHD